MGHKQQPQNECEGLRVLLNERAVNVPCSKRTNLSNQKNKQIFNSYVIINSYLATFA